MSLPSAASVKLARKSMQKFYAGKTGRGRDYLLCSSRTATGGASAAKDHGQAEISAGARPDIIQQVGAAQDGGAPGGEDYEKLRKRTSTRFESPDACPPTLEFDEQIGPAPDELEPRPESLTCLGKINANDLFERPAAIAKDKGAAQQARAPPLPLQEQQTIPFSRVFADRFAAALRRVMKLREHETLEKWHETIENFDPQRSVRAAKRKLGFLLRGQQQEQDLPETGEETAVLAQNEEVSVADNPTPRAAAADLGADQTHESIEDVYHDFLQAVVFPHLQQAISDAGGGSGTSGTQDINNATNYCSEDSTRAGRSSDDKQVLETHFFVQATPCIRVQTPSTQRLTLPHIDAMYGHQPGQINFWLSLNETDGTVKGSNSLFSESFPNRGDFRSFDVCRGELVRFYGNKCLHFTEPNKTEWSRVSLDFRIVPGSCFELDWPGGKDPKGRPKFRVGEGQYYRRIDVLEGQLEVVGL
ncbi:unnamed protein product [Amoebophrya sp. A120]|nr:unnamed protein product [Amoebophrya sp. A120]|eukprot:GSA120T00008472001.1